MVEHSVRFEKQGSRNLLGGYPAPLFKTSRFLSDVVRHC
jgi:hypothetical protein